MPPAEGQGDADKDGAAAGAQGAQESTNGATGKDGKPFDPDRAQHTIETQREENRRIGSELNDAKARLAEYEKAEQQRKDAELGDLQRTEAERDRAVQRAEKAERELEDVRADFKRAQLDSEIRIAATREGSAFNDPSDALQFIDRSALTVGEDGKVDAEAVTKALKEVLEKKPYLARVTGAGNGGEAPRTPAPGPEQGTDGQGQGRGDDDPDARKRVSNRYQSRV